MNNKNPKIDFWIDRPIDSQIVQNLHRLSSAPGVAHIAVMPDIHLSKKLCNGIAVATEGTIFPEAVGGDIGCGYLMADLQGAARSLMNKRNGEKLLGLLNRAVPIIRHSRESMADELPDALQQTAVSFPVLEKLKSRDARVQLGTLGRGNHFVEFQSSASGELHVLIHSGSRAVGPDVLAHHLRTAQYDDDSKLLFLGAKSPQGAAYLQDMQWAREYAAANRLKMLQSIAEVVPKLGLTVDFESIVDRDHNHVQIESHGSSTFWVHRKGTQRLSPHEAGIVPGSMGTSSFVVTGRQSDGALQSCSHGAGRRMSRTKAANRISARDLKKQMQGVCYDNKKTHRLCDEAPKAYKDIRKVMRAQKELVRIESERTPIVNFKAG